MNGLTVFAIIAAAILATLCLLVYLRDRGRRIPQRESRHGTWGGGDRNPYGGERREGPPPVHGQISDPGSSGGGGGSF